MYSCGFYTDTTITSMGFILLLWLLLWVYTTTMATIMGFILLLWLLLWVLYYYYDYYCGFYTTTMATIVGFIDIVLIITARVRVLFG